MPWKEVCPMDERARFILECLRGELPMTALSRQYGISRKTAYKWWGRFEAAGSVWLADRSRARPTQATATAPEVITLVCDARKAHPTWGPRKLVAWLAARYPRIHWPAASTAGAILKRHGLARARRRRAPAAPYTAPFLGCTGPNMVWCADFKGGFAVGNGRRCAPLTISDGFSRYLLRCEVVARMDTERVRPVFESAFCEFGLPQAIRTDNGPPFATVSPGGLSRLGLWWLKLGIRPERITPGVPQQNGRHERLHRTLEEDAARPPARTLADQQQAFDRFRRLYNDERPHEALGDRPPWEFYEASPRRYPVPLREPDYPASMAVRLVRPSGTFKWHGVEIYIGETLASERVGVEEVGDNRWRVYFADVPLGFIERGRFHRECDRRPRQRTEGATTQTGDKVSPMCPV